METPCTSAISQTLAITFASLSEVASYFSFAYASCSKRFDISPGLLDKRPAARALYGVSAIFLSAAYTFISRSSSRIIRL